MAVSVGALAERVLSKADLAPHERLFAQRPFFARLAGIKTPANAETRRPIPAGRTLIVVRL